MLSMTTRRSLDIPTNLPPGDAFSVVRAALADLGWTLTTDGSTRIVAAEDPTRLHCHCQPIKATITFKETADGRSIVSLETSVPGRGPISSKHADAQTGMLTRRICSRIPG